MRKLTHLAAIVAISATAGLFSFGDAEAGGSVANSYARDCSRISRKCTSYTQRNGNYDPSVHNTYTTIWVWRWI